MEAPFIADLSKITNKALLTNTDLYYKHIKQDEKAKEDRKTFIKNKYNEYLINNDINTVSGNETIYKMLKTLKYINPEKIKINNYMSSLNTGKLKKANENKLKAYNIIFDDTIQKYIKKIDIVNPQ